jgi:hypothetical protein
MTLIVEDGTGLPNAESYASVAQFRAYNTARGRELALTDGEIEALLRRATDYLQQTYYGRWAGYRNREVQALDWPRSYVPRDPSVTYPTESQITAELDTYYYPFNELPKQLVDATCELAFKANGADLIKDVDRVARRESVGPLSVEYETNRTPITLYPSIDMALARLLLRAGTGLNGGSVRLVRA